MAVERLGLCLGAVGEPAEQGGEAGEGQPELRVTWGVVAVGIGDGFAAAQQGKAILEAPTHVFQEGRRRAEVLLQHLTGEFDFRQSATVERECLHRSRIVQQSEVHAVQLDEVPGQMVSGLSNTILSLRGLCHGGRMHVKPLTEC